MTLPANMCNFRFRPSGESAFRLRKLGYKMNNLSYNWQLRWSTTTARAPLNKQTLGRIFSVLHHFSSYAPKAVEVRWADAERRFKARHLPPIRSVRFLNKFTAHRWM